MADDGDTIALPEGRIVVPPGTPPEVRAGWEAWAREQHEAVKNLPPPKTNLETAKGLGAAALTGAARSIPDLISGAVSGAVNLGSADSPMAALSGGKNINVMQPEALSNKVAEPFGGWRENKTPAESVVNAGAQSAVAGLPMEGGMAKALFGAIPGGAGEAVRQSVENNVPDWVPGKKYIGAGADFLTQLFGPMVARKAITPTKSIDPERVGAAGRLPEGLQPTAGQLADSTKRMQRERAARPDINKEQSDKFNEAVTEPTGEKSKNVSAGYKGSFIDRGFDRAGQSFDDAIRGNTLDVRNYPQTLPNLTKTIPKEHLQGVTDVVEKALGRTDPFPKGTMTAGEYKKLRSELHSTAKNASDPEFAKTLRNTADIFDNAMEQSMPKNMQGKFAEARKQYRTMLVLEKARAGAGAGADKLTPDQVANADMSIREERPHLRGRTDYGWVHDYAKTHPELPEAPAASEMPSKLARYAGVGAGTAAAATAYLHNGLPWWQAGEAGVYPLLAGELAARGMSANTSMTPMAQAWRKNQFMPLQERGNNKFMDRDLSMILRVLQDSQRHPVSELFQNQPQQ